MPEEQTNQLADLIMAIIQENVDQRIEQKIADLQDGVNTVALDDQVRNFFYNNSMSVTID